MKSYGVEIPQSALDKVTAGSLSVPKGSVIALINASESVWPGR